MRCWSQPPSGAMQVRERARPLAPGVGWPKSPKKERVSRQPTPSGSGPVACPVPSPDEVRVEVRRSARRTKTVTAFRERDTIVVLVPQRMSKADGADLRRRPGQAGAGPGGAGADPALRCRVDRAGLRAGGPLPGRGRRPPVRAVQRGLGDQPAAALGIVYAGHAGRSGCPIGCRRCRSGWSTTCWSTSWPIWSSRPTPRSFWRLVDRYPDAAKARGYLEGFLAGIAQRGSGRAPVRRRRCRLSRDGSPWSAPPTARPPPPRRESIRRPSPTPAWPMRTRCSRI